MSRWGCGHLEDSERRPVRNDVAPLLHTMSDAARSRFAGGAHAFCIYLEDGHVGAAGAADIVVVVREAHVMHLDLERLDLCLEQEFSEVVSPKFLQ